MNEKVLKLQIFRGVIEDRFYAALRVINCSFLTFVLSVMIFYNTEAAGEIIFLSSFIFLAISLYYPLKIYCLVRQFMIDNRWQLTPFLIEIITQNEYRRLCREN